MWMLWLIQDGPVTTWDRPSRFCAIRRRRVFPKNMGASLCKIMWKRLSTSTDFPWLSLVFLYDSLQLTSEPKTLNLWTSLWEFLHGHTPQNVPAKLLAGSCLSCWEQNLHYKSGILNLDTFVKSLRSNFLSYNPLILLYANFIFCDFCLPCGMFTPWNAKPI